MSSLPGRAGPISQGRLRGGILSAARPIPAGVDWRQGITFNSVCPSLNDRLWFCTDPCSSVSFQVLLSDPEGGDYTVTFDPTGGDPQTTGAIAYDGGAAGFQAAFEALSNVNPGDFTYSQSDAFTIIVTATSDGQYGCQEYDASALTIDCSGLTWAVPPGVACQVMLLEPGSEQPFKNGDNAGAVASFDSFITYAYTDCSTWMQRAELGELAQEGFDRLLSRGIASQLQSNPVGNNSPSLNSVASDITPATPADIVNTLSGLIGAAECDCTSTEVIIHAPLRAIPFFVERDIIEWDESRGQWHMGPYYFSFDCYSETGPGDVDTNADGSEIWLYATGPVEWSIGPAETPNEHDSIVPPTNDQTYLIEHLSVLRFDPCCVTAARAVIF